MAEYAYFIWALTSLILWLVIYWRVKRVRREMLLLSLICAPLGFLGIYFHTPDYFDPPQLSGWWWGIEDWTLGFTYGGLAAALYEYLGFDRGERVQRAGFWLYGGIAFALSVVWMFVAISLGINSIYAFAAFSFAAGTSICLARPRLWKNALLTAVYFTLLHSVFYYIYFGFFPEAITWWKLENVSGFLPLGIPLEEYLYTFAWGFVAGPASELCARLKLPRFAKVEKLALARYIR